MRCNQPAFFLLPPTPKGALVPSALVVFILRSDFYLGIFATLILNFDFCVPSRRYSIMLWLRRTLQGSVLYSKVLKKFPERVRIKFPP